LRLSVGFEKRQKISAQPQEEFSLSEADTTVEYTQKTILGRAKLRIEMEHPFGYLTCFIRVRVGRPMSEWPENLAGRQAATGSQLSALIEQT
jgi:hypothetical protein